MTDKDAPNQRGTRRDSRENAAATAPAGERGRTFSTGPTLFAMCLSLVLVVASVSALNLALPDLAVSLKATNTQLTWIADGYTVALAALVLPLGAMGDRFGRRHVLVAGTLVFGASSLAAAYAGTPGHLIGWRVGMGAGAAMIMPGTLSTITAAFPAGQRARGVAIWSGFAAAGAIIGMLAAGALLERWGWESIFIASAITALVAGAAAFLAPNTKHHGIRRPDLIGALLSSVAIGCLVFAIIEGNDRGWTELVVVATSVVAIVCFVFYALLGVRKDEPLLDPRLFGIPGFRSGTIVVLVQFMAVFGFFFVGLQYLQLILGYSPLKAAVALIPVAVVVLPTSRVTGWLVTRVGMNVVMALGLLAMAAGLFLVSRLDTGSGYTPFLVGVVIAGVGIGLTSSTGTSAIVGSLSVERQGVASAVNDVTREVGSAVGIAVMGSVFSRYYADNLPDLQALPETARSAVEDSPAAGLNVASKLVDQLGQAQAGRLAAAVRDAFMDGLAASLVVICIVLAVAAVGAAIRAPKKGHLLGEHHESTTT